MRWLVIVVAACHGGDDYQVHTPPAQDAAVACGLQTCETEHASCGPVGDGCGDLTLDCGACPSGEVCSSFACAPSSCIPHDCGTAACGAIADGCGGLTASCGTCTATGETCGGGGVANQCGKPVCHGLCLQQTNPATKIVGTITAPGHDDVATWGKPDPIYGATVYVPNGTAGAPTWGVTAFPPGVTCETCSGVTSGEPLVIATTGVDGTFAITNAPCGTSIPLVIQLDRWRRQIVIPSVACGATTTLTAAQSHLPRTRTGEPGDVRSDIPLIAVSTGQADPLHCVLRKIGIADSEFTDPSGAGRVRLYQDNGARIDAATPPATTMLADLSKYDMSLFECIGERDEKVAADQSKVRTYANAGGRVFTTHFSYVWLTDSDGTAGSNTGPKPWSQTASWLVDQDPTEQLVATVDQTLQNDPATQARRIAFAKWLQVAGASTTVGQIQIEQVRHDFDAVSGSAATEAGTPAQRWLFAPGAPLHFTFDTPIAYAPSPRPTTQCGRVLFSDFHVADSAVQGDVFPSECTAGPLTPQEKTLEFMLFDLASCIGPPATACHPLTCSDQHLTCGDAGDGCDDGVVLNCGSCLNGQYCGGGDSDGCGYGSCTPLTCEAAGADCGTIGNGCGGVTVCGTCPAGQTCGSDGHPNVCGTVLL